MSSNNSLHKARRDKNDEFYTRLEDIENELRHYKDHFKGKTVYCNCDDPRVSNFFEYFSESFENLGLKKLITTCYQSDNPSLFTKNDSNNGIYLVYEGDKNKNKEVDDEEVQVNNLQKDGDFRSDECIAMLKEADIVVTNPPFSLFREYVSQLIKYDKKFLIVGHKNAIIYKEIFPLIQENKMWLGYGFKGGGGYFYTKDKELVSVGSLWFTNLDIKRRNEKLEPFLHKKYTKEEFPKYDNYDAINVDKTKDIPIDYEGVMGVPITFLVKYNPDEFEILGCNQRGCHDKVPLTRKYDSYQEMKPDGTPTGLSGVKTNYRPNVLGNDGKHNYFTNGKRVIQSKYARIFIKWRK